jgi:hypothetical protein
MTKIVPNFLRMLLEQWQHEKITFIFFQTMWTKGVYLIHYKIEFIIYLNVKKFQKIIMKILNICLK